MSAAGIIVATQVSAIEIDMTELEDALRRAEEILDEKDYAILDS